MMITVSSESNESTYSASQELFHMIIRVSKRDSVLAYFLLEGHEGVALFSTISESLNSPWFREIDIRGTIEFYAMAKALMADIGKIISLEVLTSEIVMDQKQKASRP
ncbi:MAG: hypothetical protein HQK50_15930 [Oligoflexia bacterium]|nr:hypothetical protein [Oligoflexia bacterium]MBF0367064.1 hypothetical protein [Oligoflexia bacterium]